MKLKEIVKMQISFTIKEWKIDYGNFSLSYADKLHITPRGLNRIKGWSFSLSPCCPPSHKEAG
jgi:hypothetical protein